MSELSAERLAELRANEQRLGNLLALIHCDGGHYISKHGWDKAAKDAEAIRNDLVLKVDELQHALAAKDAERVKWLDRYNHEVGGAFEAKERAEEQLQQALEREAALGREVGRLRGVIGRAIRLILDSIPGSDRWASLIALQDAATQPSATSDGPEVQHQPPPDIDADAEAMWDDVMRLNAEEAHDEH